MTTDSPARLSMPKRIQLKRTKGWRKPEGAVVVSRPSRWGNPFAIGMARCNRAADTFLEETVKDAETAVRFFEDMLSYYNRPYPSLDEIRAALPAIREIGWAESVGGFEADVHSHAAPVFGPEGLPIGALAVAAPVARVTEEQKQVIRTELAACARAMTEAIGGLLPPTFPAARAA